MFLTEREPERAAAQASQVMAMRQAAQQLRVVEDWEPKVKGLLGRLPGNCLAALLRQVQAAPPPEDDDPERYDVVLDTLHTMAMHGEVAMATAVLEEMVRTEGRSLVENLTFRGLLGEMPDTTDWPRRFFGAQALKEAVERSWGEFAARVRAELEAAAQSDPAKLAGTLERQAQWWAGRLKAIAVTLVHAAINRVRREAGRAL